MSIFFGDPSLSQKLKCTEVEHDGKMAKNWGLARRLMLAISFEGLAHRGRQGGPHPAIAVEQNQNAGRSRMHFAVWLAGKPLSQCLS